ncbi:Transmembrane protein 56 [Pleurostoma richardsiae]|uniref:Transmembrane protein 56 n=1 Tax=Pleurostoma richardsiae TaxID=41990 RepID=A0AA38RVT6_9PEZI|nr:Transmembrane protein 56 [Pleurostoma richardsiae]
MRDPFFIPPIPALSKAVEPWAEKYSLPTLPLHVHEVLAAALLYTFIQLVVSPWASKKYFPAYYPKSRGKKANWDAHVVSLVQSVLINIMSLWVMCVDEERKQMDWQERIWGYTGAAGLVQAFAAGYFVWDLITTLVYIDVFGVGLLAHAVSALVVYLIGFRPFLNYYGCVFILYELSTPFLNIHWFFDKLGMTGSKAQLYNGLCLLFTFFSARLVYGVYQSGWVYVDMWRAIHSSPASEYMSSTVADETLPGTEDIMAFSKEAPPLPVWLAGTYVASNIVLNSLNFHWYFKMIKAVRKRFEPAKEDVKEKVEGAGRGTSTQFEKFEKAAQSLRRRSISEIDIEIDDDLGDMQ